MTEKKYYYGLDILRAAMMLYGVFFHVGSWLKWKDFGHLANKIHHSDNIWAIVSFTQPFRMETFFVVAGFLSCMVIRRKGKSPFFKARIKRVLYPLIFGVMLVNLIHISYFYFLGILNYDRFYLFYFVLHGWFLASLFSFALLDIGLNTNKIYQNEYLMLPILLVLSIFHKELWQFFEFIPFHNIKITADFYDLFVIMPSHYLIYYYMGSRLFVRQDLIAKVKRKNVIIMLIIGLIFALLTHLQNNNYVDFFALLNIKKSAYLGLSISSVAGIAMSLSLFIIFYNYNKPNGKIITYLINSSIAIYIVHHPLVAIFSWYLDFAPIRNIHFYIIVCSLTLIFSFGIYEIIRRNNFTKVLFGLK